MLVYMDLMYMQVNCHTVDLCHKSEHHKRRSLNKFKKLRNSTTLGNNMPDIKNCLLTRPAA